MKEEVMYGVLCYYDQQRNEWIQYTSKQLTEMLLTKRAAADVLVEKLEKVKSVIAER